MCDPKMCENGASRVPPKISQKPKKSVKQGFQNRGLFPEGSPRGPRGHLGSFWRWILGHFGNFLGAFSCFPMCFLHVLLKNECFPMRLVQFHLAFFYSFQGLRFPSISCQMYRKIMKQRWDRDSGERRRRRQRQERRKGHIYRERHQTETGTETRTQIPRERSRANRDTHGQRGGEAEKQRHRDRQKTEKTEKPERRRDADDEQINRETKMQRNNETEQLGANLEQHGATQRNQR